MTTRTPLADAACSANASSATPPTSIAPLQTRRAAPNTKTTMEGDLKSTPKRIVTASVDGTALPTNPVAAQEDDIFARAQAMGLRLTREELERTRAGVAAFLRAERVATPTLFGASLSTSGPSSSAPPSTSSSAAASAAPLGSSTAPSRTAGPTARASTPSLMSAKSPDLGSLPTESAANNGGATSSVRPAATRPGNLSFFTAIVAPDPSPVKLRPGLEEVGNAEERRRRRERRRRLREKLAASYSEPESSLDSPSTSTRKTDEEAKIHSTSPSSSRSRARTISAGDLSSSAMDTASITAPTLETSPGLRRLSSRAWMTSQGQLTLTNGPLRDHKARTFDEGSSDGEESEIEEALQPLGGHAFALQEGFQDANRAGWGPQSCADSPTPLCRQRLSLLDRVMQEKRNPRRLRSEGKERQKLLHQRTQQYVAVSTQHETKAVEVADQHSGSPDEASNHAMSLPAVEQPVRRISHARQPSIVGKSVRWASNADSPVHQRMTTRDHYQFLNHGITPGTDRLGDLEMDNSGSFVPASHEDMPWLFPSASLDDIISTGSPVGRSSPRSSAEYPSMEDLHATLLDSDFEEMQLPIAHRGLLFATASAESPNGVPSHSSDASLSTPAKSTPFRRVASGFSDPSLSQSPSRGFLGSPPRVSSSRFRHHRSTSSKVSLGNVRDFFASMSSLTGAGSATGSAPRLSQDWGHRRRSSLVPQALEDSSVLVQQRHGMATINPATIFGSSMPPPPAMRARIASATMAQPQMPLPEPTKHWAVPTSESMSGVQSLRATQPSPVDLGRLGSESKAERASILPDKTATPSASSSHAKRKRTNSHDAPATSATSSAAKNGKQSASTAPAVPASTTPAASGRRMAALSSVEVLNVNAPSLAPPAGSDPNLTEWDREDGSRLVKLVSEELQQALDTGTLKEEPPARYYVLAPGWGSSKEKPAHASYAGMIGRALLASSDQRLSLSEIYNWISSMYPFYEPNDRGWQNSIRHNLSLNKSFVKVEREDKYPGKGNWWAIEEGHQDRFGDGLYHHQGQKSDTPENGNISASGSKKKKKRPTKSSDSTSSPAPRAPQPNWPLDSVSQGPLSDGFWQQHHQRLGSGESASSPSATVVGPATLGRLSMSQGTRNRALANHNQNGRISFVDSNITAGSSQSADQSAATPHRQVVYPGFMSSAIHSSGVPMLIDSGSSPVSSPVPNSDALMPPPSLGPSSTKKGNRLHRGSHGEIYPNAMGQGQDQLFWGNYPVNSFYMPAGAANAQFLSSQPSPLAGRVAPRGSYVSGNGAAGPVMGLNGSPLRAQGSFAGTGSPNSKAVATFSPVSSVRGSSRERSSANGKVHGSRGLASGNGSEVVRRQGTISKSKKEGRLSLSASPSRVSVGRFGATQTMSLANSAGNSLQMAVGNGNGGMGSMGPSIGGLGMGFHSTNITPHRISSASKDQGAAGPSPSPTIRRLQAQQNGQGWLEDPFDYQGALQHELEAMSGLTGTVGPDGSSYTTSIQHAQNPQSGNMLMANHGVGGVNNAFVLSPMKLGAQWGMGGR